MKRKFLKSATALGFAAALAASVPNMAVAAPFGAGNGEALKGASAGVSDVTEVRRRHGGGRWLAYGLGAAVVGSALAYPYYRGGYGPGYSAYGPAQKCWYQTGPYRGQGYWGWC